MVQGCLRGEPAKKITGYLRKALHFPRWPFCHDLASDPDKLFSELKTQILNPILRKQVRRASINDKNWASIDARVIRLGVKHGKKNSVPEIYDVDLE